MSDAVEGTGAKRPVLALRDLKKTKGDPESQSFTLHVPELVIEAGSLVAIVGESGCGKTTLLDILSLISEADTSEMFTLADQDGAGDVDIIDLQKRGAEAALAEQRAHIGYVLQTGGLLPFLSVEQNASVPFRVVGRKPDVPRIAELATRLGIGDKLSALPKDLSGGQRQRAAILRGLAHSPSLLFADEPTAAVDWTRAVSIMQDFSNLVRENGVSVVLVTHDLRLVENIADQIFGFELTSSEDGRHVTSRCVPRSEITATPVAQPERAEA